jgi:hypothetical protein
MTTKRRLQVLGWVIVGLLLFVVLNWLVAALQG